MDKEPNKNNEPNEEAKVLSDEELEGVVGGAKTIPIPCRSYQICATVSLDALKGENE